jgi:glycosyltransferase involved in cell wall biosynthesis
MTPKNILLISRCPPYPLHLGDRLIIWHLARELSQMGYVLDLLAFAQFPSDFDETAHYTPYFRHITLIPEPKRSPLSYLRRVLIPRARFPHSADGAWSPSMWDAITQHLQRDDYDMVHLFGSVQVYEFLYALGAKLALITPYESYSLFMQRLIVREGGLLNWARAWLARRLEAFMFQPYPHVVVLAQPDKDMLLRLNPQLNVHVISNGIDLATFADTNTPRDAHTLLFVGNYEYAPNVDAALFLAQAILPVVRQDMPQAQLWLVGNAPPPVLQQLASEHIRVTGYVDDVRPYYAQATLFVCPLRVGAGIKNKILEAMAMGLPIVATPIAVDGIAVQQGVSAWIDEAENLAQGVLTLLQDAPLRQILADNAQQTIHTRYSWRTVAEKYATIYKQ